MPEGRLALAVLIVSVLSACAAGRPVRESSAEREYAQFLATLERTTPALARHRDALIYGPPLPMDLPQARAGVSLSAYRVDRPQSANGLGDGYGIGAAFPSGRVLMLSARDEAHPVPAELLDRPAVPAPRAVAAYRAIAGDPAFLAAQSAVLHAYLAPGGGGLVERGAAPSDCRRYREGWSRLETLGMPYLTARPWGTERFFGAVEWCAQHDDPRFFFDRVRADPRAELPVGGGDAYTRPVPAPDSRPDRPAVLMLRFNGPARPFVPPYVYPPTAQLRVAYPSGVVEHVTPVAARDLGLSPDPASGALALVPRPPAYGSVRTMDEWRALHERFVDAEAEVLTRYLAGVAPSPGACRTYLRQLGGETPLEIVPALRAVSPAFFAAVERCAATDPGGPP